MPCGTTGIEMPPKGKLPDAVVADFERWVRMGAPDPRDGHGRRQAEAGGIDLDAGRRFWAYQPPATPRRPRGRRRRLADRRRSIASSSPGWRPEVSGRSRDADRATLIRRLVL